MITDLIYKRIDPPEKFRNLIAFYWSLDNPTNEDEECTILPDGYFDIIYVSNKGESFHPLFFGLSTKPANVRVNAHGRVMSISFKLSAAERVLDHGIAGFTDRFEDLEDQHWPGELPFDFEFPSFCNLVAEVIGQQKVPDRDETDSLIFESIYKHYGNITVNELSRLSGWGARKMNRYFQHHFGIPLKTYCNILRFRSSFDQLHHGELYPPAEFTDQSHFIREVRKYSGTTPGVLARNPGDRFIQFSTLHTE